MAVLLHVRGFLVLHASAIGFDGKGVIFLGEKGAGKSTMAAALLAVGGRLLSDDVVAITTSPSDERVIASGFPQMKVYPEAASLLTHLAGSTLKTLLGSTKQLCRLPDSLLHPPLPPARIYVLHKGKHLRRVPMGLGEALTALLRHSYIARFPGSLKEHDRASSHLRECASLTESVQVSLLELPDGAQSARDAAALVRQDLFEIGASHVQKRPLGEETTGRP